MPKSHLGNHAGLEKLSKHQPSICRTCAWTDLRFLFLLMLQLDVIMKQPEELLHEGDNDVL
jgi:hypothetical protein